MGVLVSVEGDGFVILLEKLGASFRFSRAWVLGVEIMGVLDVTCLSGGRVFGHKLSELSCFTCGECDWGVSCLAGFGRSVFLKVCLRSIGGVAG